MLIIPRKALTNSRSLLIIVFVVYLTKMNKLISLLLTKRLFDIRSVTTRIAIDGKDVPKKKQYENRITLIGADNSVSITDLKNAQNLSTRRELKLVKIQDADSKTRRPVYRFVFLY